MVKNLPANAGNLRDAGSIPASGRCPGGRHGNLLQYSCLEDPRDRGTWWATVHGVPKSQTRLKQLSICTDTVQISTIKVDVSPQLEKMSFTNYQVFRLLLIA